MLFSLPPKSLRAISHSLFLILFCYGAGLTAGLYWHPWASVIVAATLGLLAMGVCCLKKRGAALSKVLFAAGVFLAGVLLINQYVCPDLPGHHIYSWAHNRPMRVEGFIYRPPEALPSKTRLHIKTQAIWVRQKRFPTTGNVLLTIKDCRKHFLVNDRILFSARLRKPRNFENPGGFDYVRWLSFQGIYCICHVSADSRLCKLGTREGKPLLRAVNGFRVRTGQTIDRFAAFPENYLLRALLLGERKLIPKNIRESFNRSGTAHILAISGLHIGIIAAFAFILVRHLLGFSERILLLVNVSKLSGLISLVPIFLYALIAGAGVSVQRAFIMVATCIIALVFDRERNLYHALALAALMVLLIQPPALFGASFRLSFVSVLGILFFSPLLVSLLPRRDPLLEQSRPFLAGKLASKLALFMVVSFSAILATAPLVAHHFSRVSLSGLVANLVIVPLVGFAVVPLGLLGIVFIPVSSVVSGCLFSLSAALCGCAIGVADFFASVPFTNFLVVTPKVSEVACFYLFLLALFSWRFFELPRKALFLSLCLLAATSAYWNFHYRPRGFQMVFLDVGQGDATLLRFPQGKTMLIDGGGFYDHSFDTGANVIAPFLLHNRIRRVDCLVMSHPHPDHFGGLRFIAQNFAVQEFWTNGDCASDLHFEHLLNTLRQKEISVHTLHSASPSRIIQGVKVEFLHPPLGYVPGHNDTNALLNDRSLVLRFSHGNVQSLFAGDIHVAAERALLSARGTIDSTILKVPHHGSVTSSSIPFLGAVGPHIAVCSVGHQNPFRLPHPQVLQRLENKDCAVYRTDIDGAVEITTDGEEVLVRCGGKLSKRGCNVGG